MSSRLPQEVLVVRILVDHGGDEAAGGHDREPMLARVIEHAQNQIATDASTPILARHVSVRQVPGVVAERAVVEEAGSLTAGDRDREPVAVDVVLHDRRFVRVRAGRFHRVVSHRSSAALLRSYADSTSARASRSATPTIAQSSAAAERSSLTICCSRATASGRAAIQAARVSPASPLGQSGANAEAVMARWIR